MAKAKVKRTDGLGAYEIGKIRSAIRQVWQRSLARKMCHDRAIGEDGFYRCEQCEKTVPKVHIDHIERVGDVDSGFITRLFCESSKLQALCKECHRVKTNEENRLKKSAKGSN